MNTEQKNYGKKIKISNEYIERERMKNFRKIIPYTSDIAAASVEKREYLRNTIFFDTSGRDGMQMYRAFVNNSITRKESKKLLVEEIMRFGIPVIELGYPASSEEEFRTILELVELREKLKIPVRFVGLAGTVKEHIKAVKDANLDEVHIFSSGSEAHCWVKFNATPEQMLPVVYDSIKYAIDIGFKKILFSFEDSFSSDPDFLLKVGLKLYEISRENNIEIRYNIPDTIGIADVVHAYGLIRFLSSNLPLRLDVHFHNDTLNAVQNSIFAVFAGASRIQGTFLGIGERTGNASINDILVQMYLKYGIIPYSVYGEEYDLSKLKATCETLSKIIGIEIPFNHPGIGEYAFAHASGIHANAMLKCMRNGMDYSVYALKDPTTLGNTEKIVLGPTAGKSNHIIYLNALGIEVNEDELNKITLSDKTKSYHKHISDAEYILNVYEIIKSKKAEYISVDLSSVKLYVSENEKYMT
ncbi:MAG: LeuA family protein, partial [Candidatus Micrarchaeota archaeon]|nr:LeuA family protein [Candidatus Micrarchaeota archaeon]